MKKAGEESPAIEAQFPTQITIHETRGLRQPKLSDARVPQVAFFYLGGCLFLSKSDGWSGRSFFLVGDHRSEDTKLVIHR